MQRIKHLFPFLNALPSSTRRFAQVHDIRIETNRPVPFREAFREGEINETETSTGEKEKPGTEMHQRNGKSPERF